MPRSSTTGQFKPVHGHTSSRGGKTITSRTYQTWSRMKDRVLNSNHIGYVNYGGRGIKVCPRWLESFENFLADMGQRPPRTSIERRDNDGDYTKENCYWATPKQQQRNKRTNLLLEFHGVKRTAVEWAERFYLPRHVVYGRLRAGWAVERTLLTDVDMRFSHKRGTDAVC